MKKTNLTPDEMPTNQINPTPKKKKGKGCLITIICILAFMIVGILVQWITVGSPHGDKAVAIKLESLQKDSIELNKQYRPASYSHPTDINNAVREIEDLGKPWRTNSKDSAFFANDPRTSAIWHYNIEKSREVLEETLPSWRRAYAYAIDYTARLKEEVLLAKTEGDDATELCIYSPKFLDKDERKSYLIKNEGAFIRLGFKSVMLGVAPTSDYGELFTF